MSVLELYQQKLTTAEEAVKVVKSGDWKKPPENCRRVMIYSLQK